MDSKHYDLLNNGSYTCSKTDWEADSQKLATVFTDGTILYIYTDGDYEGGCTYAFAKGGHWYVF